MQGMRVLVRAQVAARTSLQNTHPQKQRCVQFESTVMQCQPVFDQIIASHSTTATRNTSTCDLSICSLQAILYLVEGGDDVGAVTGLAAASAE
jgi:hypothetical protein